MQAVPGLDPHGPVGRYRLTPADDDVHGRLRREPEMGDLAADHAVDRADRVLDDLRTEAPDRAAVAEHARPHRLAACDAQRAREWLERRALHERRDHDDDEDDVE